MKHFVTSYAVRPSTTLVGHQTNAAMFDVVALFSSGKRYPVSTHATEEEAAAEARAWNNDADVEYSSSASPYGVDHSVG